MVLRWNPVKLIAEDICGRLTVNSWTVQIWTVTTYRNPNPNPISTDQKLTTDFDYSVQISSGYLYGRWLGLCRYAYIDIGLALLVKVLPRQTSWQTRYLAHWDSHCDSHVSVSEGLMWRRAHMKVSSPANITGVMTKCQVTVESNPESNDIVRSLPECQRYLYQILKENYRCS